MNDFRLLRKFSYPGEGWGLTSNGEELFMSDGTYDSHKKRLFVTGKLWPSLFEIRVVPKQR
jgi:glutamine cyclotransferase